MIRSRLKVALAKADMTQKRLAEITGVRPPTVSMAALGTLKHIPVDVLDAFCRALNCQPGDLFEYVPDE